MRMLRAVIANYKNEFRSDWSDGIIKGFNDKQKKAFSIILENVDLEDSILNKKLAEELYGCSPSYSSYKSFKDSFGKLLLKIVSHADSRGSELQKIAFELQDELTAINKLIYMGLRDAARPRFKKILKKAIKYHNFEVARSIALIIVDHHILYGKNNEQIQAITEYEEINTICNQENTIKTIYGELTKFEIISEEVKKKYFEILIDLENRIKFDSYLYRGYYYQVKLLLCKQIKYEEICNDAIAYFSNLWFNHSAYISIFRNRLLKHRISKGDFVKSKLVLNALMEDHRPFTYHWYLYALTYVRVLLYAGDTSEAYKWYKKVVDSRNYITLPKDHRNEWEVLGIYVYLMADDISSISIRKVKYNLNYNKTERSKNNINFLIAELIYEIKSGKLDIDKKVNHLQKLGKDNNRIQSLCKSLRTGEKYKPKMTGTFEDEIVAHERLVSLV